MFTSSWSWMALLAIGQFNPPETSQQLQFQPPQQNPPAAGAFEASQFGQSAQQPLPADDPARPAAGQEAAPAPFGTETPAQPLSNVDRDQHSALADRLYNSLAAAAGGLEGRRMTLLEVLAASDARNRRDVVRTYWQLASAMLDYQYRGSEARLLERASGGEEYAAAVPEVRAALAAAVARRTEAQVRVIEAQQRLAAMLQGPLAGQMLLASDAPHAGPYRTKFDALFAGRPAPPQAMLLNRILPLRHQEVAARAQAVEAAEQAVAESLEAFQAGQLEPLAMLSDLALLASVRRTLVESLRQYNDEIADYALGVTAAPEVQTVAAMLIKPRTAQPIPGAIPADTGDAVQRTQFEQQPAAPPAGQAPDEPFTNPQPVPDEGAALSADETAQLLANTRVYQGLVGVEPNKQTQRLVISLYRLDGEQGATRPEIKLVELLRTTAANPQVRSDLIGSYWRATEYAARRLVLDDVSVQLEALEPIVEEFAATGHASTSLLDAATQAARADLLATEVALLAEQFRLTTALARDINQPWPQPTSVPHGGRYLPKTESFQSHGNLAGQARHIAALHELLVAESAAVVETDEVRSDAVASFAAGRDELRTAMSAIAQQTDATLSLLSNVTRYNQQIAHYALTVLPANTPPELVESALVARTTEDDRS